MKKQNLTLTINKTLVRKARRKGVNLSAFLEIRLTEYLSLYERKRMLPSGFEPEYTAREAVMIGRTTLREQHNYPPDATCTIDNS